MVVGVGSHGGVDDGFLVCCHRVYASCVIERDKIKDVAVAYQENQVAIFDALNTEFSSELSIWQASIDKETLSFQFDSPEVLFDICIATCDSL